MLVGGYFPDCPTAPQDGVAIWIITCANTRVDVQFPEAGQSEYPRTYEGVGQKYRGTW